MISKQFTAGDIIFKEGDEPDYAYYLLSGKVEVTISTENGPYTLAILDQGEFFGEMGIIDDKHRVATVKALTDVDVEAFDEEHFDSYILENRERLHAYMSKMFEHMRSTNGPHRYTQIIK